MRFTYYSDKSIRQCISALSDRMEASPTKARPAMDGHIEKGGKFSLAVTMPVGGRFYRKTKIRGNMHRDAGITVIEGNVPTGVPRERIGFIIAFALVVGVLMLFAGAGIFGILVALMGVALYIPLVGDYNNGEYLLKELKKAVGGKEKPPKK